jgi:hypothetical protein
MDEIRQGGDRTLGAASWHMVVVLIGQQHALHAEQLAIQTEIGYNAMMILLQSIVVVTLVSVLYLYLRQSNQD